MVPSVAMMRGHYAGLRMPIVIMAGKEDQILDVGRQSVRLHQELPHSRLELVPGAGHMVHYAAPEVVAQAVETVSGEDPNVSRATRLAA